MNRATLILVLLIGCLPTYAQHPALTLEECQEKARENFPLIKRYGLIEKTVEYNLSNAGKGYLPQFALSAKASWQTDVTSVPLPGIPSLHKDQYQATIDVNQNIWDGGGIRSRKEVARAVAEVERHQLNVDIYTLEERVNNLFFGIVLFEAQLKQNEVLRQQLERNLAMIESYVQNGLANQTDLDAVKVEILRTAQLRIQIAASRKAYIEMLSAMINEPVNEDTILVRPQVDDVRLLESIYRPELLLFRAQQNMYEVQKQQVTTGYMPRLSLFAQGGYGRPGLNMLDRDFSFYAIGGVQLSWSFGSLYTQKNDKRKLEISQRNVDTRLETFLYNTHLQMTQESNDIQKLRDMLVYDEEIVALHRNVREAAEAKVANGILNVTDLMQEVDAENLAELDRIAHGIQLLMAIYTYKNTTGYKY